MYCYLLCEIQANKSKYCPTIVSAGSASNYIYAQKEEVIFFLKASCMILLAIIPHYAVGLISFLWPNPIIIVIDQYIRKFPYKEQSAAYNGIISSLNLVWMGYFPIYIAAWKYVSLMWPKPKHC